MQASRPGPPRADVAVVFVHGIGSQKDGTLVEKWTPPCEQAVVKALGTGPWEVERAETGCLRIESDDDRDCPADVRFRDLIMRGTTPTGGTRTRRLRFTEAVWADRGARPRAAHTLRWMLLMLPAVVLLLAFDARDEEDLDLSKAESGSWRTAAIKGIDMVFRALTLRAPRSASRFEGRLVLRFLTASVVVGMMAWGLDVIGPIGWGAALALLVGLLSFRRTNLAGHVIVAVRSQSEADNLTRRVRDRVVLAAQHADRVIVVAHSQGGFLAHRVLSRGGSDLHNVDTLIGLGSGLKPIHILRHLREDPRRLAAMWAITVTTVVWWWVLFSHVEVRMPDGVTEILRSTCRLAVVSIFDPTGRAVSQVPTPSMSIAWPWDGIAVESGWAVAAAATAVLVCGVVVRHTLEPDDFEVPVKLLPGIAWTELSSPHDVVGRLLYPRLPADARSAMVAVGGHPVLDHVSYFRRFSPVPDLIAHRACDILEVPGRRRYAESASRSLSLLGSRRRRLCGHIIAAVATLAVVSSMLAGATAQQALVAALPTLAILMAGISIASAQREMSTNLRWLTRMPEALAKLELAAAEVEVRLRQPRHPASVLLFTLAFMNGLAGYVLTLRFGEDAAVVGAAYVAGGLTFGAAIAFSAGYRPSRPWSVVVAGLVCSLVISGFTRVAVDLGLTASEWWRIPGAVNLVGMVVLACAVLVFGSVGQHGRSRSGTVEPPSEEMIDP